LGNWIPDGAQNKLEVQVVLVLCGADRPIRRTPSRVPRLSSSFRGLPSYPTTPPPNQKSPHKHTETGLFAHLPQFQRFQLPLFCKACAGFNCFNSTLPTASILQGLRGLQLQDFDASNCLYFARPARASTCSYSTRFKPTGLRQVSSSHLALLLHLANSQLNCSAHAPTCPRTNLPTCLSLNKQASQALGNTSRR
jgi:hypothetical protein